MCICSINCSTLIVTSSVDCGPPGNPQRGSLESYTSTTEGSEVFYSCNPGLVPEGRMRAICTRSGWSPNPADLDCTEGVLQYLLLHIPNILHVLGFLNLSARNFGGRNFCELVFDCDMQGCSRHGV